MNVAFRVDSSVMIGSGHVVRCRTLARELRHRGVSMRFICREQRHHLSRLLTDDGFDVVMLTARESVDRAQGDGDYRAWLGATEQADAADTVEALRGGQLDWVIVDHYGLGEVWESAMRSTAGRILAIDDLANRRHACDVLLDQNWFGDLTAGRYDGLVPAGCQTLLGPQHALLPAEYRIFRAALPDADGSVRRVLVYFGASDDHNLTAVAVRALSDPAFDGIAVDIVLGSNHPDAVSVERAAAGRAHTVIHQPLPTLAGLMARADLMVGTAGGTTWERAALGLPGLVAILTENQRLHIDPVRAGGAVFVMPAREVDSVDAWREELRRLTSDAVALSVTSKAARSLTDGGGTERVARVIVGSQEEGTLCRTH